MLARYNQLLKKRPVLVNTVTGTVLCLAGDIAVQGASQHTESRDADDGAQSKDIDVRRAVFFTIFGGVWAGPVTVPWFGFLDRTFPVAGGAYTKPQAVLRKLAVHQGFMNPVVYIPAFLGYWGFTMGHVRAGAAGCTEEWHAGAFELGAARAKIIDEWLPAITKCWAVWIPATSVMFAAVPLAHQPLFIAVVSLGWNAYLSFFANDKASDDRIDGTGAVVQGAGANGASAAMPVSSGAPPCGRNRGLWRSKNDD